jgi:hypothetical protein
MGVVPLLSIIYGDVKVLMIHHIHPDPMGEFSAPLTPLPWNLRVVVRFVRARQSASARLRDFGPSCGECNQSTMPIHVYTIIVHHS